MENRGALIVLNKVKKTMKNKDFIIKASLSIVFAAIVWAFWALLFPHALVFQEQLQCFLFDSEYLCERMAMPAGMARYIGEFLVQMYNKVMLGGLVIAVVFALLQLCTWCLARMNRRTSLIDYVLTFVPVIMLWYYMGDEKVKLTFAIALLMAELAMMLCPGKEKKACKAVYLIITTPLLAWLAGPTVLFFGLYVLLRDNIRKPLDYISIAMIVFAPACVLACVPFCTLPAERLFYGYHYSMVIDQFPVMQYVIMTVFAVLPVVLAFVPVPKTKKNANLTFAGVTALIAIAAVVIIRSSFSSLDYEVINYDAMVRAQKWDKIIATAEKQNPSSPLTVASLNLALAMKGQLNERASQFYQNGWQGAFPLFDKNFQSSLMTAEVHFYLGLVNTAQRLDFESMEALPDNAKSVRVIKRLAETNIINGQYEAARKYLTLLQKTMFYSGWATRMMSMLYNDKEVEKHELYGRLRKLHLDADFVFSDTELDKIMGQLVIHDKTNRMAAQYLLFLPQLEGNQQKYMMYRDFLQKTMIQ